MMNNVFKAYSDWLMTSETLTMKLIWNCRN